MKTISDKYSFHIYSYVSLRKAVGWIGILLPFVLALIPLLIFKSGGIESSISHYYYTTMRDVFVGALCAVALFMFFYCGYDRRDDWAGNLAGIFAIGVAWFPATESGPIDTIGIIHFTSATLFFLTLAAFSLILFTKTKKNEDGMDEDLRTDQKKIRNVIYIVCGVIMIACLAAIAIYEIFIKDGYEIQSFVFWAESIALIAFGFSWLTKGKTIFPDEGTANTSETES